MASARSRAANDLFPVFLCEPSRSTRIMTLQRRSDTGESIMPANVQPPKFRFFRTLVLPALLVFFVPVISFFFFRHAQARFDAQIRDSLLAQIRSDPRIAPDQRERAIAFFTEVPFSQLLSDERVAALLPDDTRFHYATFRWMILISTVSIGSGIAVFLLAGICMAL